MDVVTDALDAVVSAAEDYASLVSHSHDVWSEMTERAHVHELVQQWLDAMVKEAAPNAPS